MLRALVESASRFNHELSALGYEKRSINWVIDIDPNTGNASLVGPYRNRELSKSVPTRGERSGKASEENLKPALLVDKATYALGIAELGKDVKGLAPGDRVTFDSTIYCGKCSFCRRGLINLCDNRQVLGVSCDEYRRHGAFAEYVAVPQRILYRLPDEVGFEQAAMVEPVSIAFHAVARASMPLGQTAVVVGDRRGAPCVAPPRTPESSHPPA